MVSKRCNCYECSLNEMVYIGNGGFVHSAAFCRIRNAPSLYDIFLDWAALVVFVALLVLKAF